MIILDNTIWFNLMIFNHICLDRYWLVSLILLLVRWCFLSDYVWNWLKTNTFPGRISPSSFSILDNESKFTGVLFSEICEILGWLSVFPADLRCRCWRRLRWECTISAKMPVLPTWWNLEEISWLLQQSSRFQRWGCLCTGGLKECLCTKTHRTKTV